MDRAFADQLQASMPRLRSLVAARLDGDVDDVVQRIVVRAWVGRTGLRDAAALPAWLSRIAANEITDVHRRRRLREVPLTQAHDRSEPETAPDASEQEQMSSCVQELATELPEAQRAVVVLHHGHGLSHAEVAQELGCSVPAAKTRAHRGRARLADLVEQRCEVDRDARGVLVCTPRPTS